MDLDDTILGDFAEPKAKVRNRGFKYNHGQCQALATETGHRCRRLARRLVDGVAVCPSHSRPQRGKQRGAIK